MTQLDSLAATLSIEGCTSAFADIDGTRIHYWIGGDPEGPPILLWHGFLGTSFTWHRVMPMLVRAGYAVLAPDMRGYGDSAKPSGTDGYDARALAEEFRALIACLGFGSGKPLSIVGYDMGGPPALIWAADHPSEVDALLYIDVPVMIPAVMTKLIVYSREAMPTGSLWWWVLPLAPEVPERLIVGREREFLTWFYENKSAVKGAVSEASVQEFLRSFSGSEGVLGALGLYRAAFTTMDQTEALETRKVEVPIFALGGDHSRGDQVRQWLTHVASNITGVVIPNCGHFVPEEQPEILVEHIESAVRIS